LLESISKRIIDARLSAKGSGETDPITPNKSVAGRDKPEGRVKTDVQGLKLQES
jgi:outer membrane protein OmpA-like peptidoglycan-associated protein